MIQPEVNDEYPIDSERVRMSPRAVAVSWCNQFGQLQGHMESK